MDIKFNIARDYAVALIDEERLRQIRVEGWTADHDDAHEDGGMLIVARAYLDHASGTKVVPDARVPENWPWALRWWKPKGTQRDLERAGALCLAEISRVERIDEDHREASALYENIVDHLARFLVTQAST